jgi:hypothetical protein
MGLSDFWRELRDVDSRLAGAMDLTRRYPGYFTKPIFHFAVTAVFVLALYALVSTGTVKFDFSPREYWVCNSVDAPCLYQKFTPGCDALNPLCTPIESGLYPPGTIIGDVPPFIVENFSLIAIAIIALAAALNHCYFLWRMRK